MILDDNLLDAYLDGSLTPEERANLEAHPEFEHAIAVHRAAIGGIGAYADRRIKAHLGTLIASSPLPAETPPPPPLQPKSGKWIRLFVLLFALATGAFAWWWVTSEANPTNTDQGTPTEERLQLVAEAYSKPNGALGDRSQLPLDTLSRFDSLYLADSHLEALRLLTAYAQNHPELTGRPYLLMGACAYAEKTYSEAQYWWEKATIDTLTRAEARLNLGILAIIKRRDTDARQLLNLVTDSKEQPFADRARQLLLKIK